MFLPLTCKHGTFKGNVSYQNVDSVEVLLRVANVSLNSVNSETQSYGRKLNYIYVDTFSNLVATRESNASN